MDRDAMLKRLDRIPNIPTLPQVALRVNQMLGEPGTSVTALSETIMKDQVIVTNILRLVNSAFYGFPSKIDSLTRAIMVLGYDTVRNAVLAVCAIQTLDRADGRSDFTITEFWRHSIAVAVTGRQLSRRIPLEVPETCFVAGLLHDMGKVVMSLFFKEEFASIMDLVGKGMSFVDAEQSACAADHAAIGSYLARKWHLPECLVNAIALHHKPVPGAVGGNLAGIVHAADLIVNRIMKGYDARSVIAVEPGHAATVAGLIEDAPKWFTGIRDEIESAYDFFNIL